jgi:hypothetical protein
MSDAVVLRFVSAVRGDGWFAPEVERTFQLGRRDVLNV